MKATGTCPKCRARALYHSACVMDRGDGNEALCLAITRSDPIEARDLGQFEVLVCRSCGLTEFYVIDPGSLEA